MPVISMFYGIIIQMFFFDNKEHNKPHIHVRYNEYRAVFTIDTGDVLAGELPQKQRRLVEAWIELHRDELVADWSLAVEGNKPYKIEPLK